MFRRLFLTLGILVAIFFLLPLRFQAQTLVHKVVPTILAVQTDSVQSTSSSTAAVAAADTVNHQGHSAWFWPSIIVAILLLVALGGWYISKSPGGTASTSDSSVTKNRPGNSGSDRRT